MSIAVFHQVNTQCMVYKYKLWLVVSTPLKNMKVSWGYYSENMENVPNHQPELIQDSLTFLVQSIIHWLNKWNTRFGYVNPIKIVPRGLL